jgi:hypothetical protein
MPRGGGSKVSGQVKETGRQVSKSVKGKEKPRAGTTNGAIEAMRQAVEGWPEPPEPLQAKEMPFWHAVVQARLPEQWAPIDLAHAANLARCLADIEANRASLLAEGTIIETSTGPKINPRCALLESLLRLSMSFTRVLQLQAVATVGPASKQVAKKGDAATAAAVLKGFNADDLLARPRLQ